MLRILLKLSAFVASSWTLSRCLYRLRGIALIGPPSDAVWYFAYGANMHDSAFREWRGMRPIEWRPARLPGYRLRFDVRQLPGRKMAYANLSADPQAESGACFTRSPVANSSVSTPPRAFHGRVIDSCGLRWRTSPGTRSGP